MTRVFIALLQEEQTAAQTGGVLGALETAAEWFIGLFQAGADTFVGFVTGIIPLLIVLLTFFYTLTNLIGQDRVNRVARFAAGNIFTRYTLLPVLAVLFLTNPMAYTFGTFLEEKYKPAFYDSAVSFVHPPLGDLAVRYLIVGLIVILKRGIMTQYITAFLARRQGVEL